MNEEQYCTFYLVRHGQSEANVRELFGTDSELTEKGRMQAQDLSKQLREITFDAVFSSDRIRAKQTAEIIALERKIAVQTNKLLREKHWGSLDGRVQQEVREELSDLFKATKHMDSKKRASYKLVPDIESEEEMTGRFLIIFREIAVAYPGKKVLIVSHAYLIRLFLLHVGFTAPNEFFQVGVTNLAFVKFLSDGVDFIVKETQGLTREDRWF
jgi:broad specificity phosphatase PhoE